MRTTLTLDDDVAAQLERLRKARDASFKDVVNEALRHGVQVMSARPKKKEPFQTRVYDGGKPFIDNLDDVEAVLSVVEGDFRK